MGKLRKARIDVNWFGPLFPNERSVETIAGLERELRVHGFDTSRRIVIEIDARNQQVLARQWGK